MACVARFEDEVPQAGHARPLDEYLGGVGIFRPHVGIFHAAAPTPVPPPTDVEADIAARRAYIAASNFVGQPLDKVEGALRAKFHPAGLRFIAYGHPHTDDLCRQRINVATDPDNIVTAVYMG